MHIIANYKRLMYPEPEDNGNGGGETNEPENKPEPNTNVDPFSSAIEENDDDNDDGGEVNEPSSDDEFDWEGIDYDDRDKELVNSLCEKHGLSKKSMSPFIRDVQKAAKEYEAEQIKKLNDEASDALRKKWGASFDDNVKKTGSFIRRMGKAVGWSEEAIKSFSNPKSFEFFHDIMRYTGESKMKGKPVSSQESAKAPETLESVRKKLTDVETNWRLAKRANDHLKMKEMSDAHVELLTMQKKFMGTYDGKPAPRFFGY